MQKIAIFVVVAAVLIITGAVALHLHHRHQEPKVAAGHLIDMVLNTAETYKRDRNFKGVSNSIAIYYKDPAPEMVHGQRLVSVFGGPVKLASATRQYSNDSLAVSYSNVPSDQCGAFIGLVKKYFQAIKVNSALIKDGNQALTQPQIQAACNAQDENRVTFVITISSLLSQNLEFHKLMSDWLRHGWLSL